MSEGGRIILVCAAVFIICIGFYHLMNEKEKFETFPDSEPIEPKSRLGQHILSNEFWDELNLSNEIRENLTISDMKMLGVHNMSGYAVFDWYRILNLNNNWVMITQ